MRIFRKTNIPTRVHKNGHNLACDQYFFMKLAPLDSAHIELSFHAKNSVFLNIPSGPFPHMFIQGNHALILHIFCPRTM